MSPAGALGIVSPRPREEQFRGLLQNTGRPLFRRKNQLRTNQRGCPYRFGAIPAPKKA